ncbi:MAG TPA: DUF1127 domain-containing protein [Thermohalobaculum sp.]|nr:DUF1127 domain-containing protein [Thermohalobaculum sp.]
MAHIVATTAVPFGALTVHRIVTAALNAAAAFRRWNETRRTVAELRQLSPRQLDDIGLTQADIERMANRAF